MSKDESKQADTQDAQAEPATIDDAPAYGVPPWPVVGDNNAFRYEVDAAGVPVSVMFRNEDEARARLPEILELPIVVDELRQLAALVTAGEIDEARARIESHVRPLVAADA